jgi:hypothetical protein
MPCDKNGLREGEARGHGENEDPIAVAEVNQQFHHSERSLPWAAEIRTRDDSCAAALCTENGAISAKNGYKVKDLVRRAVSRVRILPPRIGEGAVRRRFSAARSGRASIVLTGLAS